MPRLLRILMTGSAFAIHLVYGALIGFVLLPVARLGGRTEVEKIARAQTVLHYCSLYFVKYMRFVGLLNAHWSEPPEPFRSGGPCVVIANHPALLDVIMLSAMAPRLVYPVKQSWFRNPLIRPLLKLGGHIPGPSGNEEDLTPVDNAVVLDGIVERLGQGFPVLVFPEGTRSPPDGLRRFERGAFEAAIRANVPLIAYKLVVDPPTLMKQNRWFEVPNRRFDYDLELLWIKAPEELTAGSRALRRQTRAEYERALGIGPARPADAPAAAEAGSDAGASVTPDTPNTAAQGQSAVV